MRKLWSVLALLGIGLIAFAKSDTDETEEEMSEDNIPVYDENGDILEPCGTNWYDCGNPNCRHGCQKARQGKL